MKRSAKRILLLCVLSLLLIGTLSFGIAVADALHTIEYDYYISPALPSLTWKDGIVRSEGEVIVTNCDIIYKDENGELAVETVELSEADGYSYTFTSHEIVRVLPVDTVYMQGEQQVNVHYKNEYIYSVKDLEKANVAKAYNNVFSYLADYEQSKARISRTLCFMRDMTFDEEFTVLFPCSVEFLTSCVRFDSLFSIIHSYAGVYYIRADGGSIHTDSAGEFSVNAPNAKYFCDDSLSVNDLPNRTAILNAALSFACDLVPEYTARNLLLQSAYQNYGIPLTYTVNGEPFDGIIADSLGQTEPVILPVTVTASYDGTSVSKTVDVHVVDLENGNFVCEALAWMTGKYCDEDAVGKTNVAGFDLAVLIKDLFGDSLPEDKYLTVFLSDDSDLQITDENATSLRQLGSDPADRVSVSGDIAALSLYVRKGTVNVATKVSLYYVYGDQTDTCPSDPSVSLDLEPATPDEIIYYLKNMTPAFITNKAYGVLNVQADGVHAGSGTDSLLTGADFGITDITGVFGGQDLLHPGTVLTDQQVKDAYFGPMSAGYTYTLKNKMVMISPNHAVYFRYTVQFGDGEDKILKTFDIPVFRAALGEGGESEMFTSDNQLASYFINEDMNWLAPESLTLSSDYFSLIRISKINDIEYDALPADSSLRDLLTLNGSDILEVTDPDREFDKENFFRSYDLRVNPNYIPASNTTVKVHCYLYNNNTENDTKISEFDYEFVIPGILKCSSNGYATHWEADAAKLTPYTFTDNAFYTLVVNMLGEAYTSEVLSDPAGTATEYVVLSSATNYEGNALIDPERTVSNGTGNAGYTDGGAYTAMIFSARDIPTIQNVDGIQVFDRIEAVVLDGIEITGDIYALSDYYGLTLKYLSMKGCSLTNAKIYRDGTSAIAGLYLKAINLADNGLENVDGLLMRTVQVLDLSGNSLTDIQPLSDLRDLTWLDLSENQIRRFETLKQFEQLQTVFVTENHPTDPVYGAKGGINIPVYVWIMKTNGVSVYADRGDATPCGSGLLYGYALSEQEIQGSVVLNAIASHTVLNDAQLAALKQDIKCIPGYTVAFLDYGGTEQADMVLYTDAGMTVPDTVYDVVCYYRVFVSLDGEFLAQREFCVTKSAQ